MHGYVEVFVCILASYACIHSRIIEHTHTHTHTHTRARAHENGKRCTCTNCVHIGPGYTTRLQNIPAPLTRKTPPPPIPPAPLSLSLARLHAPRSRPSPSVPDAAQKGELKSARMRTVSKHKQAHAPQRGACEIVGVAARREEARDSGQVAGRSRAGAHGGGCRNAGLHLPDRRCCCRRRGERVRRGTETG